MWIISIALALASHHEIENNSQTVSASFGQHWFGREEWIPKVLCAPIRRSLHSHAMHGNNLRLLPAKWYATLAYVHIVGVSMWNFCISFLRPLPGAHTQKISRTIGYLWFCFRINVYDYYVSRYKLCLVHCVHEAIHTVSAGPSHGLRTIGMRRLLYNKLRIEQQKFINKQSNCSARIESFISGVVFRRGVFKTPTQFVILPSAISLYVSKEEKYAHTTCTQIVWLNRLRNILYMFCYRLRDGQSRSL